MIDICSVSLSCLTGFAFVSGFFVGCLVNQRGMTFAFCSHGWIALFDMMKTRYLGRAPRSLLLLIEDSSVGPRLHTLLAKILVNTLSQLVVLENTWYFWLPVFCWMLQVFGICFYRMNTWWAFQHFHDLLWLWIIHSMCLSASTSCMFCAGSGQRRVSYWFLDLSTFWRAAWRFRIVLLVYCWSLRLSAEGHSFTLRLDFRAVFLCLALLQHFPSPVEDFDERDSKQVMLVDISYQWLVTHCFICSLWSLVRCLVRDF